MSHNVEIQGIKITSLDAIEKACAELRAEGVAITLERGTTERGLHFRNYEGRGTNAADHVIRLGDCKYDIGLIRQPGGHYLPVYDNALGISVACPIACAGGNGDYNFRAITSPAELALAAKGIGIGKLMQRYSAVLAEQEAKRKGYLSRRVVTPNGAIQVQISVR